MQSPPPQRPAPLADDPSEEDQQPHREEALAQMREVLHRVGATGTPALMLVRGGTGEDRASFLRVLHARARDAGALFLCGAAKGARPGAPYGPLAEALAAIAPRIAAEPGSLGARLRQRVAQAPLGSGALLVELCPALAPLLPAEGSVEPLPVTLAVQRFETVARRLLSALAQPEHPLVLVLDRHDAADADTLRILTRVLAHPETQHLLVVAASSGMEEPHDEAALRDFERGAGFPVERVDLGPGESGPREVVCPAAAHGPDERDRRAEEALARARTARERAAFGTAAEHLATAGWLLRILGEEAQEEGWRAHARLAWEITFGLAECAAARCDRPATERLVEALRARAESELDRQAAERILVELFASRGEHAAAMARAEDNLARLGVRLSPAPSSDEVRAAFEAVWSALGDRAIEELADLGPMTDPEARAATAMLVAAHTSALGIGDDAFDVLVCRLVCASLTHGNADASALGYAALGTALVRRFGDYRSGYRFGKVAYDLAEGRGGALWRGMVGTYFGGTISIWTHHLRASIGYAKRAFEAALASGNTLYARQSAMAIALGVLVKGDPLEDVYREASLPLCFARGGRAEAMADVLLAVGRFVECKKGRTTHLSTWSGSGFDEAAFEARVTPARMPLAFLACRTLKLASRYLAGEYDEALAASAEAEPFLAAGAAHLVLPEWHYYSALATAARRCPSPEDPERAARIASHAAALERWAERCPENFHHKHVLVLAEASRLAGRDLEAMRLYDQAIAAARDNGFVHCQAITAEAAVRFYLERGFTTIAATYLRLARSAYARWGADGKVVQLDRRYARLALGDDGTGRGTPNRGEPIDAVTAVRTAQAVSEEIVLQRLLVTLMRIVVEHGGAQRCHVLLAQSGELTHAGQAYMDVEGMKVEVSGAQSPVLGALLPESIIGYVRRTREPILLEDATAEPMFSADPYVARERPRSVLCMPIVRQAELVGIFYMENNLVPGAFTSRRLALLEFLAAQAAISLEHARLYADLARENTERRRTEGTLRRSEARLRRLVETANVIPWEADAETERFIYVGPQAEERLGWPASAWYKGNFIRDHVHPEDRDLAIAGFTRACTEGSLSALEFRMLGRDGRAVWLHMVVSVAEREGGERLLSGFFFDVTERKEAEETLRKKMAIIAQQQEDIRALSTPILDVWEGVVAMPVLGGFDEARAARAMDVLLETVCRRGSRAAILDVTGVSAVDAATAEHLVRLVRAVELVGARAVVVGIRAEVARAIVSLGLDLGRVEMRASLRDALVGMIAPALPRASARPAGAATVPGGPRPGR